MSRSARDLIARQARDRGREPFLYFEDQVVTFGELDRRVNRAASGLQARGAGPGTGVAIVMPNRPEWLYVFFATQRLGAYAVPVNTALKGDSLRHVIGHSDASVIVCDAQTQARVRDVTSATPQLSTSAAPIPCRQRNSSIAPKPGDQPTSSSATALQQRPIRKTST